MEYQYNQLLHLATVQDMLVQDWHAKS
jgi:hypothetical protein